MVEKMCKFIRVTDKRAAAFTVASLISLMCLLVFAVTPVTAFALTANEAVDWADEQTGLDTPYQCAGFVQKFTRELFDWSWRCAYSGGIKDLMDSRLKLPGGEWERFATSSTADVRPGDIVITKGAVPAYGHGGIAISKTRMIDANGGSDWNLGRGTRPDEHEIKGLVGVIRPPYDGQEDAPPPVNVNNTDGLNGTYYIASADGSGNVLNVFTSGRPAHNNNVTVWAGAADDAAQQWTLEQSGGAYLIRSSNAGVVLNVYRDGAARSGDNVNVYNFEGDDNQYWVMEDTGNGVYAIRSKGNTGVALTATGSYGSGSNATTDVRAQTYTGAASQLWTLESMTSNTQNDGTDTTDTSGNTDTSDDADTTVSPQPIVTGGDIALEAAVMSVGIKFDWTPNQNPLGYRIYRSDSPDAQGISITDFPIADKEYIDVNVRPDTTYYYSICAVESEAGFDPATMDLTSETLGAASGPLEVTVAELTTEPLVSKHFILMELGKDTMRVDEEIIEIDPGRGTTPQLVNGRTLVPIRAIIETMGGTVGWDEATKKITLDAAGHTIEMWLDETGITVDGGAASMDIAPATINDRTMLPIRFVAENVGCQIEWIGSAEQIVVVFYI